MTSQSPRIYIYKITFEEVPYYYHGVHKEKVFDEYYMGSPVAHKWCWELYTPKKQILEIFPYTDEGWIESQEVESRIIKVFYQTDKWCLNENCGGKISLNSLKKAGIYVYESKIGWFKFSKEERVKISKLAGKKGGKKSKELGVGIFGLTKEERREHGSKMGKLSYEFGTGIHGRTEQKMVEDCKKGAKNTNSQKWMCEETGYITTSGPLTLYQKTRSIDTSKRVRIL
jgi:hypothetical protein